MKNNKKSKNKDTSVGYKEEKKYLKIMKNNMKSVNVISCEYEKDKGIYNNLTIKNKRKITKKLKSTDLEKLTHSSISKRKSTLKTLDSQLPSKYSMIYSEDEADEELNNNLKIKNKRKTAKHQNSTNLEKLPNSSKSKIKYMLEMLDTKFSGKFDPTSSEDEADKGVVNDFSIKTQSKSFMD